MLSDSINPYICSDCASKNNGKWPDGHIATWHYNTCGFCDEKKPVTHRRNWEYPRKMDEKN